jgi:hypothetical protein
MEEGEADCEMKADKLKQIFANQFLAMYHTVHPSNIPGEARGKSSNVAWASTFYAANWMPEDCARFELITVMDGAFICHCCV